MVFKQIPNSPEWDNTLGGGHFSLKEGKIYLKADHFFKEFAAKNGFKTPVAIFTQTQEKRDETLCKFVQEAVTKFEALDIATSIIKYRYAAKINNYMDTSKDQAASVMILSDTIRLNYFELFEDGIPIVEEGKLLNGLFGKKLSCSSTGALDMENQVADTLYLPDHVQERGLPPATFILFGAKCRKSEEFDRKAEIVVNHRAKFKDELLNVHPDQNRLYVDDPLRKDATKYRLLCTVFDMEKGKLFVVTDKKNSDGEPRKPSSFSEWVKNNLNDLLSSGPKELEEIARLAEKEGGLLEKLKNPSYGPDYHPWSDLMQEVAGNYQTASKAWRYALLKRHVENVEKYEKRWQKIVEIEKVLNSVAWIACDDGREPGNVKVLAAMPSKKEYMSFYSEEDRIDARLQIFAPHYVCGMLTAMHGIHNYFKRLGRALEQERKNPSSGVENAEFEYNYKVTYFADLVKKVLEKGGGPVASVNVLRKHLPSYLKDEYDSFVTDLNSGKLPEASAKTEDRVMVEFLHSLFVDNKKKMRSVLRRGFEIEQLETDKLGFAVMPAAVETYERLVAWFDEYASHFTKAQVNALVIEESVRIHQKKIEMWEGDVQADKRVEWIVLIRNNRNGQANEVPPIPQSAANMLDVKRTDYFLNNWLSPEEVTELGLDAKKTFEMVA